MPADVIVGVAPEPGGAYIITQLGQGAPARCPGRKTQTGPRGGRRPLRGGLPEPVILSWGVLVPQRAAFAVRARCRSRWWRAEHALGWGGAPVRWLAA